MALAPGQGATQGVRCWAGCCFFFLFRLLYGKRVRATSAAASMYLGRTTRHFFAA